MQQPTRYGATHFPMSFLSTYTQHLLTFCKFFANDQITCKSETTSITLSLSASRKRRGCRSHRSGADRRSRGRWGTPRGAAWIVCWPLAGWWKFLTEPSERVSGSSFYPGEPPSGHETDRILNQSVTMHIEHNGMKVESFISKEFYVSIKTVGKTDIWLLHLFRQWHSIQGSKQFNQEQG